MGRPGNCLKVLVVDDDPGSLLVAQAAVEQSGHECLTAANGDIGWDLYQRGRPHVVVPARFAKRRDGVIQSQRRTFALYSRYSLLNRRSR